MKNNKKHFLNPISGIIYFSNIRWNTNLNNPWLLCMTKCMFSLLGFFTICKYIHLKYDDKSCSWNKQCFTSTVLCKEERQGTCTRPLANIFSKYEQEIKYLIYISLMLIILEYLKYKCKRQYEYIPQLIIKRI